jgi:fatty acid desaturase
MSRPMRALSKERKPGAIFAHDRRDAWLIALSMFEFAGKWALCLFWPVLPLPFIVLSMAGFSVLNAMNYICVAHDFLHAPFFTRRWANQVWGVLGSVSLMSPITLYRAFHLNHHRFGMDHRDVHNGETRDWSSIYRRGPDPARPEPLWRYVLLGPLRQSPLPLIAEARRQGETRQLIAESVAVAAAAIGLAILDWRGVLFIYLPIYYFGQVVAYAEAYSEHVGATPGDRGRDAVSCYNRLYNWLCFNNGYHQEHHFRPGVHWTQTPALRSQLAPEAQRRVVPAAHLLSVFRRHAR